METWRDNMPLYLILTILSVLTAFGIDHYLLGDKMNVFVGLSIGIGPVFLLMLRDILLEVK